MFFTNLAAKIMFLLYSRKFFFIKILNSLMLIIVTGGCRIIRNRKLKTENRKSKKVFGDINNYCIFAPLFERPFP